MQSIIIVVRKGFDVPAMCTELLNIGANVKRDWPSIRLVHADISPEMLPAVIALEGVASAEYEKTIQLSGPDSPIQ